MLVCYTLYYECYCQKIEKYHLIVWAQNYEFLTAISIDSLIIIKMECQLTATADRQTDRQWLLTDQTDREVSWLLYQVLWCAKSRHVSVEILTNPPTF